HVALTESPASAGLDEWLELYHEVTVANRAEADAGRRLLNWFQEAGFDTGDLTPSAGVWCYATAEDRAWWSETWAERVTSPAFAKQALSHGLADDVALESLADAWREWGQADDGWSATVHGQVLARG